MKLDGMLFDKYEGRDVSIYATTETIDEFIDLFGIELFNPEDYVDALEGEYSILSRVCPTYEDDDDTWIIEPLKRRGEQLYNETDVVIIETGVVGEIDFKKIDYVDIDRFEGIITYVEELLGIEVEEDIVDEYISDWLDDVLDDMFYEIENEDVCPSCTIKKYMKRVYESAKEDVVNDIINYLED